MYCFRACAAPTRSHVSTLKPRRACDWSSRSPIKVLQTFGTSLLLSGESNGCRTIQRSPVVKHADVERTRKSVEKSCNNVKPCRGSPAPAFRRSDCSLLLSWRMLSYDTLLACWMVAAPLTALLLLWRGEIPRGTKRSNKSTWAVNTRIGWLLKEAPGALQMAWWFCRFEWWRGAGWRGALSTSCRLYSLC